MLIETQLQYHPLCGNDEPHLHKEDDTVIEFQLTYVKETRPNGDMLYIAYPDIFRVKVYRDLSQYLEDEKKADAFEDSDLWTGNRIIF